MDLEDRLTVPSAEGIDLHLVLAGLGTRSLALLIDLLIQVLLLWLLAVLAGTFAELGAAAASIGAFGVLFGYHVAFEAFNGGRTPGKALLGINVTNLDGTPVRLMQSIVRNVVRFVDLLPGMYFVGFVAVLATSKAQRVGDLAAGTIVVRRPRVQAVVPTAAGSVVGPAGPVAGPPNGTLAGTWDVSGVSADEVAAIRAFLDRRPQLTSLARTQLADTLATQVLPKVAGVPLGEGAEAFLERIVQAKDAR